MRRRVVAGALAHAPWSGRPANQKWIGLTLVFQSPLCLVNLGAFHPELHIRREERANLNGRSLNMVSKSYRLALFCSATVVFLGIANARAQEGVTFQTFSGTLVVLDNPTTPACQAVNVYFTNMYSAIYRFAINPAVVPDALAILGTRGEAVMVSTQSPNFSLQGPSTTTWSYINIYAFPGTFGPSSSNLTLQAGLTGLPVAAGNANVIINGSINDFLGFQGCNVTKVHAALVRNPD